MDYDAIIIGSGFGGAIGACRLAEAGYKVLILERGRRWDKKDYPRSPGDAWFWDHKAPERHNGWIDFRIFPNMSVAQGAAVGGGSLIYANISCEAPASAFQSGWPPELTFAELKPHYDRVASFMNVQKVPPNQWSRRMLLMREAAERLGQGHRFTPLELAVSFDPDYSYNLPDPHSLAHSKPFVNAQGVQQGTCVHIGNCDIGCDVLAKNTLDLNYIPWAEKHGAEVRDLHLVSNLEPVPGGYRVSFDRIASRQRIPGSATARIVWIAAGSLGSTELLLRCREETRSLPNVSPFLGRNWSSNGDFLTPAFYRDRDISPSRGPTIGCAIDFLDGSRDGQSFWIEDGGFPNLLADLLRRADTAGSLNPKLQLIVSGIRHLLRDVEPFRNVMPWFAQGVDAANGVLSLKRPLLGRTTDLHLAWDIRKSREVIDAIVSTHLQLSNATGGNAVIPPTWTFLQDLVTPHPLGGCNMGSSPADGVVDHTGEVFGHPNLFVCDGAIIPRALGVNPSRTIGALAERTAALLAAASR
ncbi:MAG: GMC family oxidoreductase [Verrucomicrobiae bacterium]|nr:GMC family oxidoreductase [Verrucomicrobiae bacterium]